MLEKILPIVVALILLQFLIRFMNRKKNRGQNSTRDFDYKKRIDQFMKVSNYDEGIDNERILTGEIRSGLGKPDLMLEIPDSMREVRRSLNLIIDGVTHGVKGKIGARNMDEIKYNNTAEMFDEIVEVINRHKLK